MYSNAIIWLFCSPEYSIILSRYIEKRFACPLENRQYDEVFNLRVEVGTHKHDGNVTLKHAHIVSLSLAPTQQLWLEYHSFENSAAIVGRHLLGCAGQCSCHLPSTCFLFFLISFQRLFSCVRVRVCAHAQCRKWKRRRELKDLHFILLSLEVFCHIAFYIFLLRFIYSPPPIVKVNKKILLCCEVLYWQELVQGQKVDLD